MCVHVLLDSGPLFPGPTTAVVLLLLVVTAGVVVVWRWLGLVSEAVVGCVALVVVVVLWCLVVVSLGYL